MLRLGNIFRGLKISRLGETGLESGSCHGVLDTVVTRVRLRLWLWLRLSRGLLSCLSPPPAEALLDVLHLTLHALNEVGDAAGHVLLHHLPLAAHLLLHHHLDLLPAALALQDLSLIVDANLALQPSHVLGQE